jgi:ABC-2 type transport system ATP-binding protein
MQPGAVGLLGPNGAGKSTLIKARLGFLSPAAGSGEVKGLSIASQHLEIRRAVGYMPETDCHIPQMNAVTFVAFCGEICGMPASEAMGRAHEIIDYVGLGEARYRPVDTYSQGMRQRIKLAQALIHDPDLVLLDEPTNGMDPKGREEMLGLISDLHRKQGISVLMCSHLLPDVERVCERVIFINKGEVVTEGSVEELTRGQKGLYVVRIKGEEESFAAHCRELGCKLLGERDGVARWRAPEDDPAVFFAAAQKCGAQIRHLAPVSHTLEEAFMEALNG